MMAINVAFYDEQKRRLVHHEKVDMPRRTAPIAAVQLGCQWISGRHRIPARLWVVWDKLEDLGVFPLDQTDACQFEPIPESVLDDILACAGRLPA
jgi:hypothetical protein